MPVEKQLLISPLTFLNFGHLKWPILIQNDFVLSLKTAVSVSVSSISEIYQYKAVRFVL